MTSNKRLAAVYAVIATLPASLAVAEEPTGMMPPEALPPQAQLYFNLGSAGLLAKMNSFENYNTVQGRIGLSRAQIEFSRTSGITSGYEDSSSVAIMPFEMIYSLPGFDGRSYLRFNGFVNRIDGEEGHPTRLDPAARRLDVQYMWSPNIDTLLGIGPYYEVSDIELKHNDGTISRDGWGIRADYLQKLDPHWGLAARADLNFGNAETSIPVAPGLNYQLGQDDKKLYLQGDIVGTYTSRDASWIPDGWVFHPTVSAVYQRTAFDSAVDSFGATVTGTVGKSDTYGWVGASARFESMDFRPGKPAPYFEVGLQHEYVNDLDLMVDDPLHLHTVVGLAMNLAKGGRLDIEYSRHDGLNGKRRDQALAVHVGYAF